MSSLFEGPLSTQVLGAFRTVHRILGFGLLEAVYVKALVVELKVHGLIAEQQVPFPVFYRGQQVGLYYADLIVEGKILIEVKATRELNHAMVAQLLNYMHLANVRVGYLVNLGKEILELKRFVL